MPISLVISLSQTLKGLHWDKIPGDNDNEVAARGILYLLIFQQLGQLVRWSWGYHVLLAPPDRSTEEGQLSEQDERYRDDPDEEYRYRIDNQHNLKGSTLGSPEGSHGGSGLQTPLIHDQYASSVSSKITLETQNNKPYAVLENTGTPANGNILPRSELDDNHITSFPTMGSRRTFEEVDIPEGWRGVLVHYKIVAERTANKTWTTIIAASRNSFHSLPHSVQKGLLTVHRWVMKFLNGLWEFMNPPLWAMLAAIVVASVPSLQRLFFEEGTFIKHSVTRAVAQSGGVAVPLILVVLGANLARNTLPKEGSVSIEDEKEEKKLLIAALVSRMLLPTIVMAPLLALAAKYIPISILDDPIFVIVCFLLTGAPSALQLAQICQINGVYMGAMSRLLFQSYVIWYACFFLPTIEDYTLRLSANQIRRILPSTLILVMCALEVVEWAAV